MRQAVWVVLGAVAFALFLAGATSVLLFARAAVRTRLNVSPIVYRPSAHPVEPWHGDTARDTEEPQPESLTRMPDVTRVLPVYEARLLAGCSQADLATIEARIHDAIGIGAPLYNAGDVSGSYSEYDSAAQAIALSVEKTCKGPAKALEDGRIRAAKRASLPEQAWAMRDTFDGVLDVITRRGTEL